MKLSSNSGSIVNDINDYKIGTLKYGSLNLNINIEKLITRNYFHNAHKYGFIGFQYQIDSEPENN